MTFEFDKILPVLAGFAGIIIGSIVTIILSFKDRKLRKVLLELEISHKNEMFNIEKTQKLELFNLERKDKFRLVAVEKRIEAHQLALKHWYELRDVIHETDNVKRNKVINSAFNFWYSNALYLEKQTRERFYEAAAIVDRYQMNIQIFHEAFDQEEKVRMNHFINEQWNRFHELHALIFSEVELEPVSSKSNTNEFGEKLN